MRTVSPVARATEIVPLMDRELSSVVAPEATVPWKMPTLSVMAVTAAVVVGAVVSTVAVTAGEVVRALPAASITLAVKKWEPSERAAVV